MSEKVTTEAVDVEVVLETVVRCTEIDVNGHVNNAKFVEYLEWVARGGTSATASLTTGSRGWVRSRWW